MKKTLLIVVGLVGSLSAFAQGFVAFANLGAGVNSPFHTDTGAVLTGGGYNVEILSGATAATVATSLAPLFTGNFAAGFFNGGARTVPAGDIVGGSTFIVVRAWSTLGGTVTSYAQAQSTPGALWGTTTAVSVIPQASAQVPATPLAGLSLLNGNGNMILTPVPEPSVLALGLLGVGALLIRRRK